MLQPLALFPAGAIEILNKSESNVVLTLDTCK